ncbi:MAG: hypothetical protein JSR30_00425 [Proteobacteria bacterium]|nr:hypothetical protein [Pseudomonadota bacterium]
MSKYQFQESDIYLPGTDIPKNRLGVTEADLLHEIEASLLQQAYQIFIAELQPATRFDEAYFKSLHQRTWASLYDWAGEYRSVDMSKGGSLFCRAELARIRRSMADAGIALKRALRGVQPERWPAWA